MFASLESIIKRISSDVVDGNRVRQERDPSVILLWLFPLLSISEAVYLKHLLL